MIRKTDIFSFKAKKAKAITQDQKQRVLKLFLETREQKMPFLESRKSILADTKKSLHNNDFQTFGTACFNL